MNDNDQDRYERRSARRHAMNAPVNLETGRGRVCNMSGTGVYFETQAPVDLGPIRLSVELESSRDSNAIRCEGLVVRVEEKLGRRGVAVLVERMELDGRPDEAESRQSA